MRIEEFDFALPQSQIAQEPLPERDASKLLRIFRTANGVRHQRFRDLPELLRSTDLLVVNDARVVAARLVGKKAKSGGRVELLLVKPVGSSSIARALERPPDAFDWICLGQSSKGLQPGMTIDLERGNSAQIIEALGAGEYRVHFRAASMSDFSALLESAGRVPLPPYIAREPDERDRDRYQTVYARTSGSIAAPTAGLHFTRRLLAELSARGIQIAALTLDVGPGTFLPIREDEIERHRMLPETYFIPEPTAVAVNQARAQGRRVVAVGTTVVRSLEAATGPGGALRAGTGETSLFIWPGFQFRQVDALLTNFHLPRSTLLILVSAFAGRERVLAAYGEAVQHGYRFFSYGDAMLISD
ncbi:MAG TPA: tRNA preQ1(34) S-adenosylmethionine ribosyltransferase-isomerase QueA [Myxococcaceae bacterium]|nr:tRNA preQ1(34) S-adenosylmethionine ribosyltransferase-isomerase QueA [Myxococcaceae bacterium]